MAKLGDINCQICKQKIKYALCFGGRCPACQSIGFDVWGFGERGEMEKNKLSIEEQEKLIKNKIRICKC